MYLTCPSCQLSFVVSAAQLGQAGRKVRCSNCKHLWFATTPTAEEAHNEPIIEEHIAPAPDPLQNITPIDYSPMPPGVNLPAIIRNRGTLLSRVMFVMLIIIAVLLGMSTRKEQLNLSQLHMNITGLSASVLGVTQNKAKTDLVIRYEIHNKSDIKKSLPLVRAQFLDAQNKIIKSEIIKPADLFLHPDESIIFDTKFVMPHTNFAKIALDVGDRIDFLIK